MLGVFDELHGSDIFPLFLCNSVTQKRPEFTSTIYVNWQRILILGLLFLFDFEPQPREDLVGSGDSVRDSFQREDHANDFKISVFDEFATNIEFQNWTLMTRCISFDI